MSEHSHSVVPRTMSLVFNSKNQLLLLKFSEAKGKLAGFFDPPGGHIERAEGVLATANREIFEETGLIPKNTRICGVVHVTNFFGKNIMMFVTSSSTLEDKVTASVEGQPAWYDVDTIETLKIFEDVRFIIDRVLAQASTEIFVANSEFDDSGKLIHFTFENE